MDLYEHPPPLDKKVQDFLLPIYKDLSKEDLLIRCLGGHTQNANESFNATIWRLTPKHLHSGLKIVEITAFIAAGIFKGYTAILQMMAELQVTIGSHSKRYAEEVDDRRLVRNDAALCQQRKLEKLRRSNSLKKINFTKKEKECYMALELLISR